MSHAVLTDHTVTIPYCVSITRSEELIVHLTQIKLIGFLSLARQKLKRKAIVVYYVDQRHKPKGSLLFKPGLNISTKRNEYKLIINTLRKEIRKR